VKTSAGTSARTASRISNSLPCGRPLEATRSVEIAADALILVEENLLVHFSKSNAKFSARRTRGS